MCMFCVCIFKYWTKMTSCHNSKMLNNKIDLAMLDIINNYFPVV